MLFYFCQFPHLPQEQLTMQIQNVIRNMISRQIQQQQWEQRSQVLILACLCHSFNIGPYGKMIFFLFHIDSRNRLNRNNTINSHWILDLTLTKFVWI